MSKVVPQPGAGKTVFRNYGEAKKVAEGVGGVAFSRTPCPPRTALRGLIHADWDVEISSAIGERFGCQKLRLAV